MKAELIKRLFRSVAAGSEKDILKVCSLIIDDEKNRGHGTLAKQLGVIIATYKDEKNDSKLENSSEKELGTLPMSRRYNDPLVTYVLRRSLRHDMILPELIEQRFQRIEREFAARDRLASFGLHYTKRILMYGAPGCGKTLGAERLAWNTGLPLVKVRFDALISSYLGESASNLRKIFDMAKTTPCLLFLDECDSIAKSRSIGNDVGEIPRIVNTLLQLLDDFDSPGLLVAATNLDKSLDKALFRRFDDVFEIPPPRIKEIEQLLKLALSTMKLDNSIQWKEIARQLEGTSAAFVVKVGKDAAKRAILAGFSSVQQKDLEHATQSMYRIE